MRIVVPALSGDNVAARCLRAENLDVEVRVLAHDCAYAELVAELWQDGETFAIVEDDIAPWPGAINQMLACPRHWCGYHYCLPGRWDDQENPYGMYGTCGCFKVDAEVMRAAPDLYTRWVTHEWRMFDVAFVAALRHVFGLEGGPSEYTFHVHKPAVAHAMHYRPEVPDGREQSSRQDRHQDRVQVSA